MWGIYNTSTGRWLDETFDSKADAIAYYQKNRLNPITFDIRRIKNGGIS